MRTLPAIVVLLSGLIGSGQTRVVAVEDQLDTILPEEDPISDLVITSTCLTSELERGRDGDVMDGSTVVKSWPA